MKFLELKVPPVALFFVLLALSYVVSIAFTVLSIQSPVRFEVLIGSILVSGWIGIAGVVEFKKKKTTVNPVKPENASSVVDSGIFAYTRNPMYLGLFLLLLGVGYYLQNTGSIAVSFLFVLYMNRFQIQPEERVLEDLFGASYVDYKQRVRRWV
ncbi:isoprenylcysteine carboxylmethyltransferase family protein [Vibrio makurazakiensis]|uniref:methyltransferase family protein n=1 Tax=Vibrio makurazakiensis TaxID=2910250 RepID=UPI003D130FBB